MAFQPIEQGFKMGDSPLKEYKEEGDDDEEVYNRAGVGDGGNGGDALRFGRAVRVGPPAQSSSRKPRMKV